MASLPNQFLILFPLPPSLTVLTCMEYSQKYALMHKSALIASSLLTFAGAVLLISLIHITHPSLVFSQNQKTQIPLSPTPTATPTATPVDYYLPYPGILPDHFLWPVKALRDYLWVKLTFNPAQKSANLLHLADKRIGAAEALITGGQIDLGTTVATKAGKYLEQALDQEAIARNQGINTDSLLDQLAKSSLKHQEIATSLQNRVTNQAAVSLNLALDYFSRSYEITSQRLRDRGQPVPGQI